MKSDLNKDWCGNALFLQMILWCKEGHRSLPLPLSSRVDECLFRMFWCMPPTCPKQSRHS